METTEYFERNLSQKHPEVEDKWIERVLESPYYTEPQDDGRIRYYGLVPQLGHWIRVIVAEGKVHNRFVDGQKLKLRGETKKLRISYFGDADTLSLWNGQPTWSADDVAQHLIIDLDIPAAGWD